MSIVRWNLKEAGWRTVNLQRKMKKINFTEAGLRDIIIIAGFIQLFGRKEYSKKISSQTVRKARACATDRKAGSCENMDRGETKE